jgi:hypothetical protein
MRLFALEELSTGSLPMHARQDVQDFQSAKQWGVVAHAHLGHKQNMSAALKLLHQHIADGVWGLRHSSTFDAAGSAPKEPNSSGTLGQTCQPWPCAVHASSRMLFD